jgi:lipopolysaccharide biosynthesis glycosyltransferase
MDIEKSNKDKLLNIANAYNRTIHFIDANIVKKKFDKIAPLLGVWGAVVYGKWLLADIVSEEVGRILYIDSDTMVRGSLRDVIEMDMKGQPIAISMDLMNIHIRKELQLSYDKKFYNTGMVLIDVNEYREQKCLDIFMNHIVNVRKDYKISEQDIATVCWQDKITPMAMEYNYISLYDCFSYKEVCKAYGLNETIFYHEEEYEKARKNPVIVHFPMTFELKPWFENCTAKRVGEYEIYWKKSPWDYKKENQKVGFWVSAQRTLYKLLPSGLFVKIQRVMSDIVMNKWYNEMKQYM